MAITKVNATLANNTTELNNTVDDDYEGSLVTPSEPGVYTVDMSAFDNAGNVSIAASLLQVSYWKKPKTDWKITDRFNIQDYNRIKNNLNYLCEFANTMWETFEIEDMGPDLTTYTAYWDVNIFNMFERNLEKINDHVYTQDIGFTQTFYNNGPFIKWDELNRIESATLIINDLLERQKAGLRKLPFRLGTFKEVRI